MTESNSLAPTTRGCRVREVVLSHSLQNPFRSAKYPTFCPGRTRRKPHSTAHYARFYHHLQPILWTSTPTHQSKPIAHAPCSGLVQSIFRSPARLRSRFLSAYACCSHAANLKMLCIPITAFIKHLAGLTGDDSTHVFDSATRGMSAARERTSSSCTTIKATGLDTR